MLSLLLELPGQQDFRKKRRRRNHSHRSRQRSLQRRQVSGRESPCSLFLFPLSEMEHDRSGTDKEQESGYHSLSLSGRRETIVESPEDHPAQSLKPEPTKERFAFPETPDTKKKEKKPSRIGVSIIFGVIFVGILFLLLFPTVLQTLAEHEKLITIIEFSGTAALALLILIVVFIRYLKNKPTKE